MNKVLGHHFLIEQFVCKNIYNTVIDGNLFLTLYFQTPQIANVSIMSRFGDCAGYCVDNIAMNLK